MEEKRFLTASDIAIFMGISMPTAYKIIRKLNDELKANGYITIAGKVSRSFFEKRIHETIAQKGEVYAGL